MPRFALQPELRALLRAEKNTEARKLAKAMVLTSTSLASLIQNPRLLGYVYKSKRFEHVPDEARFTTKDGDAIFFGDHEARAKAFRRLSTTLKQRKFVFAHLFFDCDTWAIFYFSQADITGPMAT
jgi:hypothetical protein